MTERRNVSRPCIHRLFTELGWLPPADQGKHRKVPTAAAPGTSLELLIRYLDMETVGATDYRLMMCGSLIRF